MIAAAPFLFLHAVGFAHLVQKHMVNVSNADIVKKALANSRKCFF